MLRNEQQLTVAKRKRDEAVALARDGNEQERLVYSDFASTLDEEINEYEAIRAGYAKSFKVTESDDIGESLVKCRVSRGWTQAQLADALGLAEQQIQRYEVDNYQRASLWKISEIIDALGFNLQGVLRPRAEEAGGSILQPTLSVRPVESASNSVGSPALLAG